MALAPLVMLSIGVLQLLRRTLETQMRIPWWDGVLSKFWIVATGWFLLAQIPFLEFLQHLYGWMFLALLLITLYLLKEHRSTRLIALALIPYAVVSVPVALWELLTPSLYERFSGYFDTAVSFAELWMIGFGIYAVIQNNKEIKTRKKEEAERQREAARKAELEELVEIRTSELTHQKKELLKTLAELKAAQTQLIHAEKMASLGELTAGIAHEIQNPLNFVNNFSELSIELARELTEEIQKETPDAGLIKDLANDLAQNQQKINHHGKRAAGIVTGMLQHSRTGSGKKEPTDLNALADEYLRLSYHGLRAKDKTFNARMIIELDPKLGNVDAVPQDLGRVLLNLINNAFYAVNQKKREMATGNTFEPTVTVTTRLLPSGMAEIRIKDNGTGIPEHLKTKIFQPFFTTKPTGQGTGLGLSLAFDIITKGHGGTMELTSTEGEGTEFIIQLPAKTEHA
jgi:two-component system NtrC family sensor kinase